MNKAEILTLLVTFLAVCSISVVFTLIFSLYTKSVTSEIKSGLKDIEIIDEAITEKNKKHKNTGKIIKIVVYVIILIILVPVFIISLINKFQGDKIVVGNKTMMIVLTGSMSEKNEVNTYLVENDLNNQFQVNDLIFISKVNDSSELKLYDVIAFKNNEGVNIIHRIIAINNDGTFITQGDANNSSDSFRPTMNDIIGKYDSIHIPYIGTFILFLQSYSGIITILFLIYVIVMIDKYLNKISNAEKERKQKLQDAILFLDKGYEIKRNVVEIIYYKGVEYHFNNEGLIKKDIVNESDDSLLIKTIKDDDGNIIEETKIMMDGEDDER